MKKRKRRPIPGRIGWLRASAGEEISPALFRKKWGGYYKPLKKLTTLNLDADVLAWFKRQGRGYQTRINQALREVMREGKARDE
jgi:uncharacterized protein (DUF4415 family)